MGSARAKHPLVAVVLRDHESFLSYATRDIGDTAKSVIGYYHLGSNRMITFNVLTGNVTLPPSFMKQLTSLPTTAACSCFADNPMWVSEGLAMFFEPLIAGIPEIGVRLEVSIR